MGDVQQTIIAFAVVSLVAVLSVNDVQNRPFIRDSLRLSVCGAWLDCFVTMLTFLTRRRIFAAILVRNVMLGVSSPAPLAIVVSMAYNKGFLSDNVAFAGGIVIVCCVVHDYLLLGMLWSHGGEIEKDVRRVKEGRRPGGDALSRSHTFGGMLSGLTLTVYGIVMWDLRWILAGVALHCRGVPFAMENRGWSDLLQSGALLFLWMAIQDGKASVHDEL